MEVQNNMNSWEITKQEFCKGTKPHSVGEIIALRKAANFYVKIRYAFKDEVDATKSFNEDDSVRDALLRQDIVELHESLTVEIRNVLPT